jgi:hypothetical protein
VKTTFAQASRPTAAGGLADFADVEGVLISVNGAERRARSQHSHGGEGICDLFLRAQELEFLLVPLHDGELAD